MTYEETPIARDRETGQPLEPTEPLVPETTEEPAEETAEPAAEDEEPAEPAPVEEPAPAEPPSGPATVTNWEPVKTAVQFVKTKLAEIEAWINQTSQS